MRVSNLSRAEQLVSELEEESFSLRDHIAAGGCASFDEYRHAVGRLESLDEVRRKLQEFLAADEGD